MNLSLEIKQRVSQEFSNEEALQVGDALCQYKWLEMEPDRVHAVILDLAKGKTSEVERLVNLANDDPKRLLAADNPTKEKGSKKQILPGTILLLVVLNVLTWVVLKFLVQFNK